MSIEWKENSFCKCQLESELISSNGISTFLTNSPYTISHTTSVPFSSCDIFSFLPSSFPSLSVGCSKQERWVSSGSLWSDNKLLFVFGVSWDAIGGFNWAQISADVLLTDTNTQEISCIFTPPPDRCVFVRSCLMSFPGCTGSAPRPRLKTSTQLELKITYWPIPLTRWKWGGSTTRHKVRHHHTHNERGCELQTAHHIYKHKNVCSKPWWLSMPTEWSFLKT